ncbi:MAG: AraC family transcriptional regulator [Lentisphaerae bacterium]|nr:AraC family transcriptional regulator [Lentisphaerota bacterium]
MDSIPYIDYTKLEESGTNFNEWYYMSHLSNACASEDVHRTMAYAICLLEEGELQLESDLFVQKAEAPAIFTMAPEVIRKFTDLYKNYDARIFFFRKEVFLQRQTDINYLSKFDFFEKTDQQVIALSNKQYMLFKFYFDLIHEKSSENDLHTSEIVRSLIYVILNEIDSIHQTRAEEKLSPASRETLILSQFKRLLAKHFIQEQQVSFYAEKLHLTPKYFSTLIRQASGKTAGDWISEMLLLEAKVRLQNPNLTITQIAYDLNFSDPSHFGKFFKKQTGKTPLQFRS